MRYKLWVFISIGLFVIGIVAGIAVGLTKPAGIWDFFSDELTALDELSSNFDLFQPVTAVFIFFKNVTALLLSFIFSPFLCLLPVLALLLNGSLISIVSIIVTQEESVGFLLAGLLPHGIFEIPAFIIGEAAALSFGVATITALFSRDSGHQLLPTFKQNLRYLLLAFILLIPAAIIETFVTPLFLK